MSTRYKVRKIDRERLVRERRTLKAERRRARRELAVEERPEVEIGRRVRSAEPGADDGLFRAGQSVMLRDRLLALRESALRQLVDGDRLDPAMLAIVTDCGAVLQAQGGDGGIVPARAAMRLSGLPAAPFASSSPTTATR